MLISFSKHNLTFLMQGLCTYSVVNLLALKNIDHINEKIVLANKIIGVLKFLLKQKTLLTNSAVKTEKGKHLIALSSPKIFVSPHMITDTTSHVSIALAGTAEI